LTWSQGFDRLRPPGCGVVISDRDGVQAGPCGGVHQPGRGVCPVGGCGVGVQIDAH
jgi:hypothetical protein